MYRAYPPPSQHPPDGEKTNGTSNGAGSGRSPTRSAIGSGPPKVFSGPPPMGSLSSAAAAAGVGGGAALPGGIRAMPKIKFGNPTLGVPPPTKKQRAIPGKAIGVSGGSLGAVSGMSRDALTKLADEGIARRRAALRNLKARTSNAPSILERAKAVTSNSASNTGASSASSTTTTTKPAPTTQPQQQSQYQMRTRPIAVSHSPLRPTKSAVPNTSTSEKPNNTSNGTESSSDPVVPAPRITNLGMRLASNAPNPANTNGPPTSSPPRKQYEAPPRKKIETPAPFQAQPKTQTQPQPVPTASSSSANHSQSKPIESPPMVMPTSDVSSVPPLVDEKKSPEISDKKVKTINVGPPPTTIEGTISSGMNGNKSSSTQSVTAIDTATSTSTATAPPPVVPLLEPKTTKSKRETLSTMWNAAASPIRPHSNGNGNGKANGFGNGNGNGNGINGDSGKTEEVTTKNDKNGNGQSATLRMVKELRKAKEDKEEAMKRLARLESEVMELRLKRESQNGRGRGRGHGQQTTEHSDGSPRRRRMKSPEPTTRSRPDMDPLADKEVATRAVDTVEDVFASDLATYVVRKPYGKSHDMEHVFVDDEDGDGGRVAWENSVESYGNSATVKDDKTIEVLAKLKADGSVLLIWGSSSCRHGIPTHGDQGILGYEFKTFDDVEYMEGSLGKIIFIDEEGNDGEYWLDPVYEEALNIRESYCSNVFSAALALKAASTSPEPFVGGPSHGNGFGQQFHSASPPGLDQQSPPGPSHALPNGNVPKPPVANVCVGTEDMPKPKVSDAGTKPQQPATASTSTSTSKQQQQQPPKPKKKKQPKQKEEPVDDASGSVDILPHFILFFFSSIFSMIWFILMFPVRVTRVFLTSAVMFAIGHFLWMHFADIQDAMNMGAAIDTQYNI